MLESELQQEHDENDQEKDEVDEIAQNEYKEKSLSYQQPNKCIYYPPPGCVIIPYDKDEYEAKINCLESKTDTLAGKLQQFHQSILGFRTQNYLTKSLDELRSLFLQNVANNNFNAKSSITGNSAGTQGLGLTNSLITELTLDNTVRTAFIADPELTDIIKVTKPETKTETKPETKNKVQSQRAPQPPLAPRLQPPLRPGLPTLRNPPFHFDTNQF